MSKIICFVLMLISTILLSSNAVAQCDDSAGPCKADADTGNAETTAVSSSDTSPGTMPEVKVEKERIKPLWISGLALFGTVYITTIILNAALAEDDTRSESVGFALIPMFGPFLSLADDDDDTEIQEQYRGSMVLSGVAQIVGVAVFTAGMIIKRDPKSSKPARSSRLGVAPVLLGKHGAGAILGFSFM
jgi:hypothetical protein